MLIPTDSIFDFIRGYSEPALFVSEEYKPYSLSKSGSLTKLRVGERFFAMICRHQITKDSINFEYDQLAIHNKKTARFITSGGVVFADGTEEQNDDFDCLLFDFTAPTQSEMLPSTFWFDISNDLLRSHVPKPICVFTVGYPGYRNSIDYDTAHYEVAPNAIFGLDTLPSTKGRLAFKSMEKLDYNPSGMSGSPVFGLELVNGDLSLFFAGIIVTAGKEKFHFIPLQRLKSMFAHGNSSNS